MIIDASSVPAKQQTLVSVTDVYGRQSIVPLDDIALGKPLLRCYCRNGRRLRERDSKGRVNQGHGVLLHRDNINTAKGTEFVGYTTEPHLAGQGGAP